MSERLDELMLLYLDTIDTYQSLCASLGSRFSAGFMALAQANFNSPARRYGEDFYDERMSALRGVDIRIGDDGIVFEVKKIELNENQKYGDKKKEQKNEDKDKNENEGSGEDEKDEKDKDTKKIQRPDPRDPIRWFGILVPQALRNVQSEFISSIEIIPQLLTTLSKLSSLESQITKARTKYLYKILIEEPLIPLPEALPLSPLDTSSGFIHMCTAAQVPGVVERFMKFAEKVWLLKIPYGKIEADLKWEGITQGGEGGEEFPHLFSKIIGAGEVEDVKGFKKDAGKAWEGVFEDFWLEV